MGLRDERADADATGAPAASFSGAAAPADAAAAADAALRAAVAFAAGKLRIDPDQALRAVLTGTGPAYEYFHYGLARQAAGWLGALDGNIEEVYLFEDGPSGPPLLHLIIWAKRKTEALNSLVTALDRALVAGYSRIADLPRLAHLLDVQVVDDADVDGRIGYGALLSSLHHKPLPIWEKTGGSGPG